MNCAELGRNRATRRNLEKCCNLPPRDALDLPFCTTEVFVVSIRFLLTFKGLASSHESEVVFRAEFECLSIWSQLGHFMCDAHFSVTIGMCRFGRDKKDEFMNLALLL